MAVCFSLCPRNNQINVTRKSLVVKICHLYWLLTAPLRVYVAYKPLSCRSKHGGKHQQGVEEVDLPGYWPGYQAVLPTHTQYVSTRILNALELAPGFSPLCYWGIGNTQSSIWIASSGANWSSPQNLHPPPPRPCKAILVLRRPLHHFWQTRGQDDWRWVDELAISLA